MDESQFAESSPGRLVRIDSETPAFIPEPLPANFCFSPDLWPVLAEAKSRVMLLEGVGRNLPNPSILLNPLQDREALQSSRLEGTYITAKEFLLYELQRKERESVQSDDWREVFNYRSALLHGAKSELPFSLRLIKELHEILMTGVKRRDMTPGQFRNLQVAIGTNKRFVPPPPQYVMNCLNSFEPYLHHDTPPDPLIHCFVCHYQFETIHPFNDGNGRVGRLLLALMLYHNCGLTKPWLYLSDVLEGKKDEYCQHMFNVSAKSDWTSWLAFCLEATIEQANATIERCSVLTDLQRDFIQRVAGCGGNTRLNHIVENLFYSPLVRVSSLPDRLGVTYPTAKKDCERLVELGILAELPNTSVITYYSPEVFRATYENIGDDL